MFYNVHVIQVNVLQNSLYSTAHLQKEMMNFREHAGTFLTILFDKPGNWRMFYVAMCFVMVLNSLTKFFLMVFVFKQLESL